MIWTTQVSYPLPWPGNVVISSFLAKHLSASEINYLSTLQAPKRAHEFILGRALTRLLIKQIIGADDLAIEMSLPDNTAPRLWVNQSPWQLSIAHSMGAIFIAVSQKHPVGVDIQWAGKPRDLTALIKEYPALSDIQVDEFYKRWVCLEALAKKLQLSLADLLNQKFLPDPSINFTVSRLHNYWHAVAAPVSAYITDLTIPNALTLLPVEQ